MTLLVKTYLKHVRINMHYICYKTRQPNKGFRYLFPHSFCSRKRHQVHQVPSSCSHWVEVVIHCSIENEVPWRGHLNLVKKMFSVKIKTNEKYSKKISLLI